MNMNLFVCFIDYEKAFDRVKHAKLVEILETKGLNSKDSVIIKNFYPNQKAIIKVEG